MSDRAPVLPPHAPVPPGPMAAPVARDWLVDALRVAAMGVVVLMHWNYLRVTPGPDGLQVQHALHGPVVWALTWVVQVMPLIFILGGFANTVVLDRARSRGQGVGDFLGLRARRLMTPLVPLVAVTLLAQLVAGAIAPGLAATVGDQVANPLWFLAVYLLAVALTPVAVRLHDRVGWLVVLALLAGSVCVDAARFAGDERWVLVNMALVWLACHQLGVHYARGSLRRWPVPAVLALVGVLVAVLVVMVAPGPWYPTNLGVADAPVSNLLPPTSAITVLAVIQLALLTLARRALGDRRPSARTLHRIGTANALLMVVYLWHVPALTVVTGLGMLAPDLLLPTSEAGWLAVRPVWWALGALMLTAMVWLGTRWELLCQQYLARSDALPVIVGTALGVAGVGWMWRQGMGLTAAQWPGIAMTLVGVALLTTLRRRPPSPDRQ